jgi:hypothetical protein
VQLQTLVERGVEKNTTIVFPAPLVSAIGELGAFLAREGAAATSPPMRLVDQQWHLVGAGGPFDL